LHCTCGSRRVRRVRASYALLHCTHRLCRRRVCLCSRRARRVVGAFVMLSLSLEMCVVRVRCVVCLCAFCFFCSGAGWCECRLYVVFCSCFFLFRSYYRNIRPNKTMPIC
jgi:hypothetical protein